ncbi:hypothetical protein M3Y95_01251600 [Aphelenchoides besseyi]|nr:hypothetical protein M3Y95_01251600 [Aphelenchoides besseyi]
MLYGAETWAATNGMYERLAKTQRAMERRMTNVRLLDKKPSKWAARKRKWRFAQKTVAPSVVQANERWSRTLTLWTPPAPAAHKSGRRFGDGRPRTRWEDDIRKATGQHYVSHNRECQVLSWLPSFYSRNVRFLVVVLLFAIIGTVKAQIADCLLDDRQSACREAFKPRSLLILFIVFVLPGCVCCSFLSTSFVDCTFVLIAVIRRN